MLYRQTVSNPGLLSSRETGVNPGRGSFKTILFGSAQCQKDIGAVSISQRIEDLKLRLKSGSFKCISWLNGSFLGVKIGVF
jgi:hypothetical protein